MIRKSLVLILIAASALGACRSSNLSGGNAMPANIYAAGPTLSDVRSLLGDSTWWPGVPEFGVRPRGLPTMSENEQYTITQHYVHVGTAETFVADYAVWKSVSAATSNMSTVQSSLGATVTGPKVGDQIIYYGSRQATKSSLYETVAFVRLGQVIVTVVLTRGAGFAEVNQMAKIASKLITRLRDVLAGKIKPSPTASSDTNLLPPPGQDVTLVGTAHLPVEASAELLQSASPQDLADSFHKLGVSDFLYADYALNSDLTMEVRAAAFSFSTADDSSTWLDGAVGKTNLDASGVFGGYSDSLGLYYAFFLAGRNVGVLFCDSITPGETAARACEAPMATLVNTWQASLSR